jgi:hypothetical protein
MIVLGVPMTRGKLRRDGAVLVLYLCRSHGPVTLPSFTMRTLHAGGSLRLVMQIMIRVQAGPRLWGLRLPLDLKDGGYCPFRRAPSISYAASLGNVEAVHH